MMRHSVFILFIVVLAGCEMAGGVKEQFDTPSGLTLVMDVEPVVFARTEGRLSRSARDYLYLAPVEVNELGVREYYLWVGLASTIDRAYLAADSIEPELLVIEVNGAPMVFALQDWEDRQPRLAGRRIYKPAVTPVRVLAARATLDQLVRISGSGVDEVRIGTRERPDATYFLWEKRAWWPEFLSQVDDR